MSIIAGNGIYADDGSYDIAPQSYASFAAAVADDPLTAPALRGPLPFLDASSFAEVGWGLVTAYGDERLPQVLDALRPLLDRRKAQAGDLYREDLIYHPGAGVRRFLTHHGAGPGAANPERVPFYLLLVGGPDVIPFEFQYLLDVQYAVGRLSFDSAEEYAHYASSVIACETGEAAPRKRAIDIFGVRNPNDPATADADGGLVEPLEAAITGVEGWQTRSWRGPEATKPRLGQLLTRDSAMLMTVSHGVRYRPGSAYQKKEEGAILCYEWPGPGAWEGSLSRDFYFSAGDLTGDLTGLITVLYACNSAGTPRLDSFSRARKTQIPKRADADFVAPLPQRMLGRPGGALAVLGHVDAVWPMSFSWSTLAARIDHFVALFRQLMRGCPIGMAMETLGQRYGDIAASIADEIERSRTGTKDKADPLARERGLVYLWTAHNDARSYLLLGDPAVRAAVAVEEGK